MKHVVVTGGSRGIGLGIAETLAFAGYSVIAVARKMPYTTALDGASGSINFIEWDLADTASLSDLASKIQAEYGTIYGLVNNAGIGTAGILMTQPDNAIQALINLNVVSPLLLTKRLVKSMMAARSGRIVNMSSIVASTGYSGLVAYSASKSAMIGLTKSLAREVGSMGITVNAVAPGFIATDLVSDLNPKHREQIARRSALQRMATVDDVASVVSFLLSDGAANITGTTITVDAGNTA